VDQTQVSVCPQCGITDAKLDKWTTHVANLGGYTVSNCKLVDGDHPGLCLCGVSDKDLEKISVHVYGCCVPQDDDDLAGSSEIGSWGETT